MSNVQLMRNVIFFVILVISGNYHVANAKFAILGNTDPEVEQRVMNMPLQIEIRYTDEVRTKIDFFVEKNKKLSGTLLGRAAMYFPLIESIFSENQIPDELKFITVIESDLVPYLNSEAGASGLWQFMKPTAENLGLKISKTVDERKDAEKSTRAAAVYLKRLYDIYKDWTLVLAAYNCGDGVVNRVLRNSNSKSYWDIQKFLPKQTQEFVPKFIAAAYLMNYYYQHSIQPIPIDDDFVYTGSIKVFQKVDLSKIAQEYDISEEVLKRLNSKFIKGFIPESNGEYELTLPESKLYDYAINNNSFENIVSYSIASMTRHNDLASVAKQSERFIERASINTRPIDNLPLPSLFTSGYSEAIRLEDEFNVKVVRLSKGQSLLDLAKQNGVELASLMELNKIDSNYPPKVGDHIKIRI